MKRISALLTAALLGCALLAGCGGGEAPAELSVWSLSGENEQLRLSNGVLVLNGGEDVLHGGDLEVLDNSIPPAAAFRANPRGPHHLHRHRFPGPPGAGLRR